MDSTIDRGAALRQFAERTLGGEPLEIAAASNDASYRSYWRVSAGACSYIVMDAPPDREDVRPWLDVAARLRAVGLHPPEVIASDASRGFVLMEDLGLRTYLPELNQANADQRYADALDALFTMQTRVDATGLPVFDSQHLRAELELFPQWFLQRHLGLVPGRDECDVLENAFRTLAQNAQEQPARFIHRDYHSRNLIVTAVNNPGIIDFQGAMLGPVTYDLASLLRDCYIAWPAERVDAWVESYLKRLVAADVVPNDGPRFRRWFDLIGLQRHLKVLGIFARLCYRDAKSGYLNDLPLVVRYVLSVARSYAEFRSLASLLERAVGRRDIARPAADVAAP